MKTTLIALVALTAAAAGTEADISPGAQFETTPELAEPLLTQGLAKLAAPPLAKPAPVKTTAARLLVDCEYGKVNDVVEFSAALAKQLESNGVADTSKAAVDYARSLS